MNIKAVELMKINKNMMFGEEPVTQPAASVVETPVSQPESTLNALHQQGMNNVAFQGFNMSNVKKPLQKLFMAAALGTAALTATTSLTSCTDETTQIVSIDMESMMEMYNKMLDLYQQMLDQQKITNDQLTAMNTYMLQLLQLVKEGNMSQAEFYQAMYEYMIQSSANQDLIIQLLVQQGKTQEEAVKWLQNIMDAVKSGQMSYEEALNKIFEVLGSIDGKLSQIISMIDELKDIYKAMLEQQMINNSQNEEIKAYLESLLEEVKNGNMSQAEFQKILFRYLAQDAMNQQLIIKLLMQQGKTQAEANKLLQDLINAVNNGQLSYEEALKKIMEILGSIDSKLSQIISMINELKGLYKAMLEQQMINNSQNEEIKAYLESLLEEVRSGNLSQAEFQKILFRYLAQDAMNQQLIIKLLMQQGKTQAEANKLLQDLINAVNNGQVSYEDALKQIMEILASIDSKLNSILNEIGNLSAKLDSYAKMFSKKFDSAINKLINELRNGLAGIKAEQKLSNQYLKLLTEQADDMMAKLDELKQQSGGITLAELEALWKERDEANFEKYSQLIKDLGLKIDVTNATLEDLKNAIKQWKQDQKDYAAQLDRIIALLEAHPNYTDKLNEIAELIRNFKCNCDCGNKQGNEGIIEDLEDLLK